jgi:ATP-dependent Clp protease ATP-binding subunit ClpA
LFAGHLPFTAGAKKSLELALREAIRLDHGAIDTEMVLLGILRSDDLEIRELLAESGVDVAALREATESRRGHAA